MKHMIFILHSENQSFFIHKDSSTNINFKNKCSSNS